MRVDVEVEVWRGEILESRHQIHLAACDAAGATLAEGGDGRLVTTLRSAAKPLQLTPFVERGHAERWGFGAEALALMAGSHTGSARQVEGVRAILERVGLTESALACGFDEPLDPAARAALRSGTAPASPVYHNCSGKHAGFLAFCRSEGWPTEGYPLNEHPLQQLLHRTVAEICGLTAEQVPTAVDGCGVRVFAMPLPAMARGYARIATASPGGDGRSASLARIRDAMRAHPWAVGGAGRFSTALMEAAPHLVAKGGAEGLECVGWPERGLGVALKCEDGSTRAVAPAVIATLQRLGALDAETVRRLEPWARPRILNAAGREVGMLRAETRAPAPAGR